MKSVRQIGFVSSILVVAGICHGQDLTLPPGPGKVTTEKVCGSCHGIEIVVGMQETRETWAAIVDDMVQRGAEGTPEELYQVVAYLSANFSKTAPAPKVNINQLSAKDLEKLLRLPEAQAAAIVKAREEKGGFKSFDDLARVPGLDTAKIAASKNRLAF